MGKYTVITFSPVQEFIEKSRKLRDLYGSSFIVSYLSYFLLQAAEAQGHQRVSPGLLDVARGTPNNIIIHGHFSQDDAEKAFNAAWARIVLTCRHWLKDQFPAEKYSWNRQWNAWKNHAWEFFWATGNGISEAEEALRDIKYERAWTGINWSGESSALSGADSIAFPDMNRNNPIKPGYGELQKLYIEPYYQKLSQKVGEVYLESTGKLKHLSSEDKAKTIKEEGEIIISPREPLNIPELIKRLITLEVIRKKINDISDLNADTTDDFIYQAFTTTQVDKLQSFKEINRFKEERWTGWFLGDGDRMGKYFRAMSQNLDDEAERKQRAKVSQDLMEWGETKLRPRIKDDGIGRLVYAGGDDFMGVLYKNSLPKLTGKECWSWWCNFPQIWAKHGHSQDITVSVGFVWAANDVPQREILQQCNQAEKAAKKGGRNRIAIRVLFNSGNNLEWTCPWWFLEYLAQYRDRGGGQDWTNIFEDVAILESRRSFSPEDHHNYSPHDTKIAEEIFSIYFGQENRHLIQGDHLWNGASAGILGDRDKLKQAPEKALNNWVINLAKVGYHLFGNGTT